MGKKLVHSVDHHRLGYYFFPIFSSNTLHANKRFEKRKGRNTKKKEKKKKQTHECRQAPYPLPCPPSPGEEGRWCSQPTDPTPTSCHVSPPCPASWTIGPGRLSFRLPQLTPSSVLPHPISYHTPHEEYRDVHTRKYICS